MATAETTAGVALASRAVVATIRVIVIDPSARTIQVVRVVPDDAAFRDIIGAEVLTDLDLPDPGQRMLVDARQDGEQSDWWWWRKRAATVAPGSLEALLDAAVERLAFDPGKDAPIGGIGVLVGYDPDDGWRDTALSLDEAREAVTWPTR
jgi:hypothetical protein